MKHSDNYNHSHRQNVFPKEPDMSLSRAEQSIAEPPILRDRCISRRALLHRGSLFVAGGAALSTAPWALADTITSFL